jgi:molybdopterin-binding protein
MINIEEKIPVRNVLINQVSCIMPYAVKSKLTVSLGNSTIQH